MFVEERKNAQNISGSLGYQKTRDLFSSENHLPDLSQQRKRFGLPILYQ
jgi:hypothetical protein